MNRIVHIAPSPWSNVICMALARKDLAFKTCHKRQEVPQPPVFEDAYITISDPITTIDYLEDRHPQPPLYPPDITVRAYMRYLIRTFESQPHRANILWLLQKQLQAKDSEYDPLVAPTILDFYIAAFDSDESPVFPKWAQLKPIYLSETPQCWEYSMKPSETAGEYEPTPQEKSHTSPISPPKRKH